MYGFTYGDGITLIHFKAQSSRLYTAGDSLNCRYIRAHFKSRGGNAAQYIEASLGTLQDCAEEIESFGSAIVALEVEPQTYSLCRGLCRTLKRLDPDIRIIWFGEWVGKLRDMDPADAGADAFIMAGPESLLWRLSESDKESWRSESDLKLAGEVYIEEMHQEAFSYTEAEIEEDLYLLDRLSSPEAAKGPGCTVRWADLQGEISKSKGLRRYSASRFARELQQEANRGDGSPIVVEGFELEQSPQRLLQGLDVLREYATDSGFEIALSSEQLGWIEPERLAALNIAVLELIVTDSDAFRSPETRNRLTHWKTCRANVRLRIKLDEKSVLSGQETAPALRDWLNAGLIGQGDLTIRVNGPEKTKLDAETAELLSVCTGGSDPALLNGYLAFKTGQYPPQVLGSGVKHIAVSEEHVAGLARLEPDQLMGINSAFILNENSVCKSEKGEKYIDIEGVVKQTREWYRPIDHELEQQRQYVPHVHAEIRNAADGMTRLEMSEFDFGSPVEIGLRNYREASEPADKENANGRGLEILQLAQPADLDAFMEDVEAFEREGRFVRGYQVQGYVADSCRWSAAGQCPIKQLPRLYTEADGEVSGCGGCSAIGRIGDSYDALQREAAAISTREQLLRGCDGCEIRDTCSKCTFLPGYMTRDQYCDLRKRHVLLHRYMQVAQLLKGLRQYTAVFRDIDIREIGVSLRTCTHVLPASYASEGDAWVPDHLFVLFVGGQPLLYQANGGKLLKLSPLMALVLEAGIKGLSEMSLRRAISEVFKADEAQAETAARQVGLKLDEMGILSASRRAS
ncbi:hypothetical protein [Saccharibacillus brassicae]|uniref:Uncharacterized protein n=1 Tax=Saccharibacillus brassicae TaxID=2583377 RepID=A0A4Y6UVF8_SACBS|nr:hypothetical protein [Saccharibacillus brassicae]QDH21722.1 hypothetical protein FFV09_13220 [Saccharibacillus brassicae]